MEQSSTREEFVLLPHERNPRRGSCPAHVLFSCPLSELRTLPITSAPWAEFSRQLLAYLSSAALHMLFLLFLFIYFP